MGLDVLTAERELSQCSVGGEAGSEKKSVL